MVYNNGYFYNSNGKRYIPLGIFGCYFNVKWIDDELGAPSYHGASLVEFQKLTKSSWIKFFTWLKNQGYTAIRLFPRGASYGSAWEGLDRGGSLNKSLFDTFMAYIGLAGEYGIKTQLCLFTEPECSFYCEPMTRTFWGTRLYKNENVSELPDFQRRFIENPHDIVDYNDYFSDSDVRKCNKKFLDEIIPLLRGNENIFTVEIFNEMGWASPHANPLNTFRWEITDDYLDWSRDMVNHIKSLAPEIPVCISNPGVGLLGHDTVLWGKSIKPDFFSIHNYPDICGHIHGLDYATISDMTFKYTSVGCNSMYGEWQCLADKSKFTQRDELLLARDFMWLTMLSGAPGIVSWQGQSYGEYSKCLNVFDKLINRDLTRKKPDIGIDVTEFYKFSVELNSKGTDECQYNDDYWCPDNSATDHMHRFCVKANDKRYHELMNCERLSLEMGIDFDFTLNPNEYNINTFDANSFTPIKVNDAYHVKYLLTEDENTCIVYLRNYSNKPIMSDSKYGGQYENFALREQKAVPLTVKSNMNGYSLEIYDLDTGEWFTPNTEISDIGLGITSHDYILLYLR
jgi:hypothetical protein